MALLRRASAAVFLEVQESATVDEIRAAFRRKALETHPDKGGDAVQFRNVKSAYELLCGRASSSEAGAACAPPARTSPQEAAASAASSRGRSRSPRRQPRGKQGPAARATQPKAKKAPARPLSPRAQARSMGMFPASRGFVCPC